MSNLGGIGYPRRGLSAPEFVKKTILRVIGALTRTNIYLSFCYFGTSKSTWKYRSRSNSGEIDSWEVDYLPLNLLKKIPILRVVGALT